MEKKLTQQEIEEQELADKIKPLVEERMQIELKRGNGVTLKKNEILGERQRELEKEIGKLKTKK